MILSQKIKIIFTNCHPFSKIICFYLQRNYRIYVVTRAHRRIYTSVSQGRTASSQQRELIDWLNADATHQAYYRKMLKLYACIEMTEEDLVKQMQDSVHNRLYKQIYLNVLRERYGG